MLSGIADTRGMTSDFIEKPSMSSDFNR